MGLYELPSTSLIMAGLGIFLYLGLFIVAVRRHQGQTTLALWPLAVYLLVASLAEAAHFAILMGWLQFLHGDLRAQVDTYSTIILSVLLLQTLLVFLSQERWWILSAMMLWAIITVVLQNFLILFVTWVALSVATLVVLLRFFFQARQPLHRNRIFYWLPVVMLSIVNDITVFYQQDPLQGYLRLAGAVFLTYAIIRHHILDARDILRQFAIYFFTIAISMGVYVGGFLVVQSIFESAPAFNPLLVGASIALFISLIYAPLFNFVRGQINRLFRIEIYDASEILRQYSVNISNILEMDKLASVSVGLITGALEIVRGILFLVDPELDDKGNKVYKLTNVRGTSPSGTYGRFSGESPIAQYLSDEHKPLLQYDIDFAPAFLSADVLERKWLSMIDMDVFVPIISKGEWIGLLALGPKISGRRYTDEDLNLLSAIASQTGVALENARLVENLKKLNNQIREAYTFLDKANHDLAKIESTKSNFISIASHELRTPLTVAKAYTEMLLENDTLDDAIRDILKGIHKSTLRQIEIMDSMFDIAQIDARTIELHRQDVFLTELIRSVAQEMAKFATERQQELTIDLPQLPSITADPNALRKLFYHLIINAIKFTPNGGKVTISGKQVQPNNRDLPEGGVEIIIADTGVGVDKGFQEVIFTKFYQPGELINRHSTGKTKFKGSGMGLGLALSRGIIEVHGGRIWVESEGYDEDKCPGSQFHVVLPLRSQSESKTVRMGSAVKLKL